MGGAVARRRRGRILYSLLLLLFALSVVPLLATSYNLVSRGKEILKLDQDGIQLDKARSLSQQVKVYLGSLRAQVDSIARTLEVDTNPGEFTARVARIRAAKGLEQFVADRSDSPFIYLSVVDASGKGAGSGVQLHEPAVDQVIQEGWLRGLQGQPMMSHHLLSASLQGEPILVLAEPVNPGGAGVQGVVLAVASLAPLQSMTRDMGLVGNMEVYIVDGQGRLVAHSNPERLKKDTNFSDVEIVRQFIESKGKASASTPFSIPGENGPRKMLGTYTRVDESGWGVIVQVDEATAYHAAFQMRNQSYALVAGVTILAVILGTLFAGQISRPIQQLARGARKLAEGDYSTRVPTNSQNEVGVLSEAFNQMGAEIQKSIDEISRQSRQNKDLFMGSIRMLANAIDEKDPYTRGHSERVAYYSAVIAKHMGMSEEEVEKVHLSGIIHDVGKIGIEDKILRKAAQLTDEEYEIMKQHPRKGEHILGAVPILKQMAGAGLMHHENVDGSGYPDGLKGEEIPLLGRIVSVADAFDAMTTDRPYSKAMTFEAALARLRFLVGKKFDEGCVAAMEKASAAGDLKKARKVSIDARKQPAEPEEGPGDPVLTPTPGSGALRT
jgi:HD-GYP domain-containing protein (c-di-GMP phosphodiesterase class II)